MTVPARSLPRLALTALMSSAVLEGQPAPSPPPTFPATVETVTLDVAVTDRHGRPLLGLGPADFVVREEGRVQALTSFEALQPGPRPAATGVEPGQPDGAPARTVALVYDDLHLTPSQGEAARAAVIRLLREGLRPDDDVRLWSTSAGRLELAHPGPEERASAVAGWRGLAGAARPPDHVGDLEAVLIERGCDLAAATRVQRRFMANGCLSGRCPRSPRDCSEVEPLVKLKAHEAYATGQRSKGATLRTLAAALDDLAGRPGRKTVVLVSEGFAHDPSLPAFAEIQERARRARAAIDFIDARVPDASDPFGGADASASNLVEPGLAGGGTRAASGTATLALDSGGAVRAGRDLAASLSRSLEAAGVFYLLGFTPAPDRWDGRFHAVTIEVRRKGARAHARRGYFAVREPGPERAAARPAGTPALAPPVQPSDRGPWLQVLRETEQALRACDSRSARLRLAAAEDLIDEDDWAASPARYRSRPGGGGRLSARYSRWLLVAGLIHQGQADLAEARRRFERAVAREPGWAEAWLALGTVHETIALLPDYRLGIALASAKGGFERTRREEVAALARDCYRQALRAQPGLHEARLRLGRILQFRGDVKPARAELERVADSDAPAALRYLAQLFLGDLAERRREWAEARSRYVLAAQLQPEAPSARLALCAVDALAGGPEATHQPPLTAGEPHAGTDGERDPWWAYFRPGPRRLAAALESLRRETGNPSPSSEVSP